MPGSQHRTGHGTASIIPHLQEKALPEPSEVGDSSEGEATGKGGQPSAQDQVERPG